MLKYLQNRGYVYTLGIVLGLSVASFLFPFNGVKALEDSFELSEGYVLGDLYGQENWVLSTTSAHVISSDSFSGATSIYYGNLSERHETMTAYKYTATTTDSTQCVAFKINQDPNVNVNILQLQYNNSDQFSGGYFLLDTSSNIYIQNGGSSNIDTGININWNTWTSFCIDFDCATNDHNYYINNVLATSTNWECTGVDKIYISSSNNTEFAQTDTYWDALTEVYYPYDPYSGDKIYWYWPQDGYVINNTEWSEWALYYNLDEVDVNNFETWLLRIEYVDSENISHLDYEEVVATSSLTYWTTNRTYDLPDGETSAIAMIWGTNSCPDLGSIDCEWTPLAETQWMNFIASTTGNDLRNSPYVPYSGLVVTTSTAESEANYGKLSIFLNGMYRIFPIGLIKQIFDTIDALKNDTNNYNDYELTVGDLLPDEMASYVPVGAVILNNHMVSDTLPIWSTHIFPAMEGFVYLITFLIICLIMFPGVRDILPFFRSSESNNLEKRANRTFNRAVIRNSLK